MIQQAQTTNTSLRREKEWKVVAKSVIAIFIQSKEWASNIRAQRERRVRKTNLVRK
jgi:hypothetical protein